MCLAIPSEVVAINGKMATIEVSGVRRDVSLMILPDEVAIGEYVLVHAGFAIHKINREAAEDALNLIREIAEQDPSLRTPEEPGDESKIQHSS